MLSEYNLMKAENTLTVNTTEPQILIDRLRKVWRLSGFVKVMELASLRQLGGHRTQTYHNDLSQLIQVEEDEDDEDELGHEELGEDVGEINDDYVGIIATLVLKTKHQYQKEIANADPVTYVEILNFLSRTYPRKILRYRWKIEDTISMEDIDQQALRKAIPKNRVAAAKLLQTLHQRG